MKKLMIVALLLVNGVAIAQNIDEERMNRDLEIAKNVLATLLKGENDVFLGSRSIEGSYVPGYGVIFTIPRHYSTFFVRPPRPPRVMVAPKTGEAWGDGESVIIMEEQVKAYAEQAEEIAEKQQKLAEKQTEMLRKQEELSRKQSELSEEEQHKLQEAIGEIEINAEQLAAIAKEAEEQALKWQSDYTENLEAAMQKAEQAVITFLADYADLIGQLKPEDKILVKQESLNDRLVVGWAGSEEIVGIGEEDTPGGFAAEVSKKVITDYKSGKLTFEEFKEKVNIKKSEPKKTSPDLDMFASIFKQYYGPKLSRTFFTESTPRYEILDDFGVIFTIRTYSSYMEGQYYYMPVVGKEKMSSDERNAKIEELYPLFENDLKSFIVDYGRTIRSLDDEEQLLLKIRMTKCEECSIPKSIDVSVKMSVLKQFDQQKISRDKALAAIEIKKNFDSANF